MGPLLSRKSDLVLGNVVLLYKQLIRSMILMPAPRVGPLSARTSGGCICCNSSVFVYTGAPLYVSSRHIHEDVRFPLFADHIRALTESVISANMGNSLGRKLGVFLR
jgi:hypothetical protein